MVATLIEPEHVTCRRLASGDGAVMRQLNAVFAQAFDDPESYAAAPPSDTWLSDALARDDVIVMVAQAGDAVIAGLVAYELTKLEREHREIYIYDIAVLEPYRRRGVATALIDALKPIARARGAWTIYVQADYEDPPAIALYTKLGSREDVLHFDISPMDDPA